MTQVIDSIEANQKIAAALGGKLRRSLALQDLWPSVFDHGRARSFFLGNVYRLHYMVFVVEDGSGEKREFSLDQTPDLFFLPFAEKQLSNNAPRKFRLYTQRRKRAAT